MDSGGVPLCRFREKGAMQEAKEEYKDLIERFIALQYLFDKQWRAVKVSEHVLAALQRIGSQGPTLIILYIIDCTSDPCNGSAPHPSTT